MVFLNFEGEPLSTERCLDALFDDLVEGLEVCFFVKGLEESLLFEALSGSLGTFWEVYQHFQV